MSVLYFKTTSFTSKASKSNCCTGIPFQLNGNCFHFNKSGRKSLHRWQMILSVPVPGVSGGTGDLSRDLWTVIVCLCFWRGEVYQVCVCPALTVLCGGATFHWTVMKFPRIIKLELYPYMSPEVRFSSPPAACQFQFRAQTTPSALTSAFLNMHFLRNMFFWGGGGLTFP